MQKSPRLPACNNANVCLHSAWRNWRAQAPANRPSNFNFPSPQLRTVRLQGLAFLCTGTASASFNWPSATPLRQQKQGWRQT